MQLRVKIDARGPLKAWRRLMHDISSPEMFGEYIAASARAIIATNMAARLMGHKLGEGQPPPEQWSRSEWRRDYEEWIEQFGMASAQRRRWGYNPDERGRLVNRIVATILSSAFVGKPMVFGASLFVGVGDVVRLSEAAMVQGAGGERTIPLWRILETGTGVYASGGPGRMTSGGPIVRSGALQVFFERGTWTVVRAMRTINPGQMGRHFLLNVHGAIYESDRRIVGSLFGYLAHRVRKYSYR